MAGRIDIELQTGIVNARSRLLFWDLGAEVLGVRQKMCDLMNESS